MIKKLVPVYIYFIVLSLQTILLISLGFDVELLNGLYIVATLGGVYLGFVELLI